MNRPRTEHADRVQVVQLVERRLEAVAIDRTRNRLDQVALRTSGPVAGEHAETHASRRAPDA